MKSYIFIGRLAAMFFVNAALFVSSPASRLSDSTQLSFLDDYVTEITNTEAQIVAIVSDSSSEARGWVEWGDTDTYGNSSPHMEFSEVGDYTGFRYTISGLTPNHTYHFRAAMETGTGTVYSIDGYFITRAYDFPPKPVITSIDNITPYSAEVQYEFDLTGSLKLANGIRYGRPERPENNSSGYHESTFVAGHIVLRERLNNLIPETKYMLRAWSWLYGTSFSPEVSFSTLPDTSVRGFMLSLKFKSNLKHRSSVHWGVHSLATNCTDLAFDEDLLPPDPPEPVFWPRFTYPTVAKRPCYDLGTLVDIRKYDNPSQIDTYKVRFTPYSEEYPITVEWPKLDLLYSGPVQLIAAFDTVDMNAQNSYQISDDFITTIKIIASFPTPPGSTTPGKKNGSEQNPESFSLQQNYPNPANPSTAISYNVSEASHVTLKVYDILGKEVATIVDEYLQPGVYTKKWNTDGVASGVYYYRIRAGSFSDVKKLMIIR